MSTTTGSVSSVGFVLPTRGSGTLVDRETVLTCGHCVIGLAPHDIRFFLPPEQGGGFESAVRSVAIHPYYQSAWSMVHLSGGPWDLAVLKPETPVPPQVVEETARIYLGGIKQAVEEGHVMGPGLIAGWGGTFFNPDDLDDPSIGVRRYGTLDKVSLVRDPCGLLDFDGCHDEWEWQRNKHPESEAATSDGDSGSPLFLYVLDVDGNHRRMVAGVNHGSFTDGDSDVVTDQVNVWAALGVGSNAAWLADALGGDQDADGVLDVDDNCPPSFCLRTMLADPGWNVFDCVNPRDGSGRQPDEDADGIGDACDNCSPQDCSDLGWDLEECSNPSQTNTDHDRWGDRCDLCPHAMTLRHGVAGWQPDSDSDGVGDECDNCTKCDGCTTTSNPYVACTGEGVGDCPQPAGHNVLCTSDVGSPSGRCTQQVDDADNDDIGGECDSCTDIPTVLGEGNTNWLAEQRQTVARLGDVCDEVPIGKLDRQVAYEWPEELAIVQGDGSGPDDLVDITGTPWLGRKSFALPVVPKEFDDPLRIRHCDCYRPGVGEVTDIDACVQGGPPCNWDQVGAPPGGSWRGITLADSDTGIAIQPDTDTPTLHFESWYPDDPATMDIESWGAAPFGYAWQWFEDTKGPSGIPARLEDPLAVWDPETNRWTTHGAVVTRVQRSSGKVASTRDGADELRDSFRLIHTPLYDTSSQVDGAPELTDKEKCTDDGCAAWILPELWAVDPNPFDLVARFRDPAWLIRVDDRIAAYRGPGDVLDLTDRVSPQLAQLIGDAQTVWMPPVEAGYRARRHGSTAQAAVMTRTLTSEDRPVLAIARGRILAAGRDVNDEGPASVARTLSSIGGGGPVQIEGVTGVYSSIENAVYIVGGTRDGVAAGTIWRFDAQASAWSLVTHGLEMAPSSTVLGVGYDQRRGRLYVLDVDDEPTKGNHAGHAARLVLYDLAGATSRIIASWPYTKSHSTVRLAVDDQGYVVLIASKHKGWNAWRLDTRTAQVRMAGVLAGHGTVFDRPVMGQQHLVLPVAWKGKLRYEVLSPDRYHAGKPCEEL